LQAFAGEVAKRTGKDSKRIGRAADIRPWRKRADRCRKAE